MESELLSTSFSIDTSFKRDRHVRFLEMMYELLPFDYQTQEINTLTLAYFVLSSLDILDALDSINKQAVANWVLSFQAHPSNEGELNNGKFYGFHGSRSSQLPPDVNGALNSNGGHLASTYCALAILKIVGYDFSLIDSKSIAISMKNLQQHDGSFMPIHIGAEADLRFVYCGASISYMLDDWSGMDKEKAKEYILNCQSYDGGFGLTPGSESHGDEKNKLRAARYFLKPGVRTSLACMKYTYGINVSGPGGATYCAIASLRLMGFIGDDLLSKGASSSIIDVPLLLEWIMQRQAADGGFHGRPNKSSDTCYAFWVGGVLRILGGQNLISREALQGFLLTCQSQYGGFSKFPGQFPELYHSYYGFCGFSLLEEAGLNSLCVELGITYRAVHGI